MSTIMTYTMFVGEKDEIEKKINRISKEGWFLHSIMPAGAMETPKGPALMILATMQHQWTLDEESSKRKYLGQQ